MMNIEREAIAQECFVSSLTIRMKNAWDGGGGRTTAHCLVVSCSVRRDQRCVGIFEMHYAWTWEAETPYLDAEFSRELGE